MLKSQRRREPNASHAERRRRPLLLTLGLLAVALLISGCGGPDPSSTSSDPPGPTIEIGRSTLTHYDDDGRHVWSMDAAAVQYDRGSDQSRAQDVRVRFSGSSSTGETQSPSMTVRADALTFEHRTRNLFLRGGVQGDGPDGLTFETDRAQWNAIEETMTGNADVEIRRDDLSMRGTGFTYDLKSESLTMQSASLQVQLGDRR